MHLTVFSEVYHTKQCFPYNRGLEVESLGGNLSASSSAKFDASVWLRHFSVGSSAKHGEVLTDRLASVRLTGGAKCCRSGESTAPLSPLLLTPVQFYSTLHQHKLQTCMAQRLVRAPMGA